MVALSECHVQFLRRFGWLGVVCHTINNPVCDAIDNATGTHFVAAHSRSEFGFADVQKPRNNSQAAHVVAKLQALAGTGRHCLDYHHHYCGGRHGQSRQRRRRQQLNPNSLERRERAFSEVSITSTKRNNDNKYTQSFDFASVRRGTQRRVSRIAPLRCYKHCLASPSVASRLACARNRSSVAGQRCNLCSTVVYAGASPCGSLARCCACDLEACTSAHAHTGARRWVCGL